MSDAAEAIVHALLLLAAVFAVTAMGMSVVRRWRDRSGREVGSSHAIMTNFRELHATGGLSDEEYRTIKSKLASGVKSEVDVPRASGTRPSEDDDLRSDAAKMTTPDPMDPTDPSYGWNHR